MLRALLLLLCWVPLSLSFTALRMQQHRTGDSQQQNVCDLPGDPSLLLTTNVDLGSKKLDVMKHISKAISKHTGKPEAYIAVAINDKQDVIFAGSDQPTALGTLYSIGAIGMESNGKITSDVTDVLEEFGVDQGRM